jgi:hypothetical protein
MYKEPENIPYIIILNHARPSKVIYNVADRNLLNTTIIDRTADLMYELYDNDLTSYQDFEDRQKATPNIVNEINDQNYIEYDCETKSYKDFIVKNFTNNNKEALDILYVENNNWVEYKVPPNLVFYKYKIKYIDLS